MTPLPLDQLDTRRPDYLLLASTIALVVLGTLMVYSASFVVAHNEFNDDAYFLTRQLIWIAAGSVGRAETGLSGPNGLPVSISHSSAPIANHPLATGLVRATQSARVRRRSLRRSRRQPLNVVPRPTARSPSRSRRISDFGPVVHSKARLETQGPNSQDRGDLTVSCVTAKGDRPQISPEYGGILCKWGDRARNPGRRL